MPNSASRRKRCNRRVLDNAHNFLMEKGIMCPKNWYSVGLKLNEYFGLGKCDGAAVKSRVKRFVSLKFLVKPKDDSVAPRRDKVTAFYKSAEWARLRYQVLRVNKARCECCGVIPDEENGVKINVDHIKPVKYFWDLRLDVDNLQVLCGSCNRGKGSKDQTDWRAKTA